MLIKIFPIVILNQVRKYGLAASVIRFTFHFLNDIILIYKAPLTRLHLQYLIANLIHFEKCPRGSWWESNLRPRGYFVALTTRPMRRLMLLVHGEKYFLGCSLIIGNFKLVRLVITAIIAHAGDHQTLCSNRFSEVFVRYYENPEEREM